MIATVILIALLLSGALFALGFALLDKGDDMKRRIAELERAAPESDRGDKFVRKLVDEKERVNLANRFAEAGWYDTTLVGFIFTRIGLAAALGMACALGAAFLHVTPTIFMISGLAGVVVGFIAPSFVLDAAIRNRKNEIARRIPDLLDMVSTTVEAGTALNGALAIAVMRMKGPLADEFRMALSDVRVGMSRSDALTAMAHRVQQVDLSSIVTALVQTEKLGGNLARILDELAEEARSRRLARAEEMAAKIPVKMVIPMAFFMLPALLVMIFGPVAAELIGR
ncbi:MAG TPA: type II secretion system F family protein [Candidatus Elarobacter sp.]|jgi:tight adherence protein C